MKHLRILLIFLLALAVFSGSALGWTPVTITDDSGFASIIENQPQTIVSLAPTNTEIIFALGLGDKVAGVTEYCNYPTEALAIQKIGGYATVNIEKIVAADPDIIFANPKNGQENIDSLRQLGYTVIVIQSDSVEGTYDAIRMIGACTNTTSEAESIISGMQLRIRAITDKLKGITEKPTVMHAMSVESFWVSGSNTFQNELITLAGGTNAFADVKGWGTITLEKLLTTDPEIILVDSGSKMGTTGENTIQKAFLTDPQLSGITAVKNKAVYVMDSDTFDRGGPRIVISLEQLAQILHPEIFGEYDEPGSTAASPGFGVFLIIAGIIGGLFICRRD
ncbi:MAG: ABC transporter substrate-binding protein [Methanocorpusculum sp.]|uniref:ABC transporter substrate-binding protein n=1 Tax=Methanocorpusculum sp. TaxID=2058474 RepID=UPI002B1EFDF7|nr:ABC transporter substrate-binding protein [Methanocorpusculum sp.]MEA5086181.1 ABC transporter substrate-binding protein [Methanocorpusculum sp.]